MEPKKKKRGIFSTRSLVMLIVGIGIGFLLGLMVSLMTKNQVSPKEGGPTRPYQDGFRAIPEQELVDGSGVKFSASVTNDFVLGSMEGKDLRGYMGGKNFLAIRIYPPITRNEQEEIESKLLLIPGILQVQSGELGVAIRKVPLNDESDETSPYNWNVLFKKIIKEVGWVVTKTEG